MTTLLQMTSIQVTTHMLPPEVGPAQNGQLRVRTAKRSFRIWHTFIAFPDPKILLDLRASSLLLGERLKLCATITASAGTNLGSQAANRCRSPIMSGVQPIAGMMGTEFYARAEIDPSIFTESTARPQRSAHAIHMAHSHFGLVRGVTGGQSMGP
jgi:hypothetical protein